MDGLQELYAKRDELEGLLVDGLEESRRAGIKYAENNAEYRKARRIEVLNERRKGTPATLIRDIVQGIEYVADLKQSCDAAMTVYEAAQESINVNKIRLRAVEADIQRIWNSGGMNYGQ